MSTKEEKSKDKPQEKPEDKQKEKRKKNNVQKFIEFLVIGAIVKSVSFIPLKPRTVILQAILRLVASLKPKLKGRISENLRQSYPEKDEEWVANTTKAAINHLGRYVAQFLQMGRLNEKFFKERIVSDQSDEEIREYFKDGALCILGHLGNWEWQGAYSARMAPNRMYAVAFRQSNQWVDRMVTKMRGKGNVDTLYTDEGIMTMRRRLEKENGVVCIVADQNARRDGIFINFFGRPASTHTSPAILARLTTKPVYYASSLQQEDGKFRIKLKKIDMAPFKPDDDPAEWERRFTEKWVALLEAAIRKYPEQYFWVHNRWKTQPGPGDIVSGS